MGFWKTLGKIASIAAPIAAAPFTGGTSLLGLAGVAPKIVGAIGAAAPVIGGLAAGRAEGQVQDAEMERTGATTQQNLQTAQNNALLAEMQGRIQAMQAAQTNSQNQLKNTLQGDRINNVKDVRLPDSGRVQVRHIEGGLRPSVAGPNSRAAGALLSNQGLAGLQGTEDDIMAPKLNTELPEYERPGEPSLLDKILGVAGPAAGILGSLPKIGGQKPSGSLPPQARNATVDRAAMEAMLMDPMRGLGYEPTDEFPRARTSQTLFPGY